MSTTYRLALAFALFPVAVWAVDPPPAATTGKIVILANDRIIEGDVVKEGDQYRIRREGGGETRLPSTQVRCVCADVAEAYHYLRGQANLDDGDERLRLARFCAGHGLHSEALAEAEAAVKLRPNHNESLRLRAALQQAATDPPPTPAAAEATVPEPEPTVPAIEGAAFGQFVKKVQPVLMNACASCHASGRGGSFKLARTFSDGGVTNRRATQQNLTAVLGMLNRDRPLESPLLSRAVAIHGSSEKPPLRGKAEPAYRSLEEWVQVAATAAPPRETPVAATPVPEAKAKPVVETTSEKVAVPQTEATSPTAAVPPPAPEPAPRPTPPPAAPATEDPYDPAAFNRLVRPDGK